ncbi:MAG: RecQ family ATP-dependent DNA helicase [Candidatus Riflebacteria bacterium]|nr:RecQ family ATP-dependent DNA helicase [Candidatus Riflebacteria bacterium]
MSIAYIDIETSINNTQTIYDYGAEKDGKNLHTPDIEKFKTFISDTSFLCGHNIIKHDLVALSTKFDISKFIPIDTLYLSPLLYPQKDSHELGKEEKLFDEQINNPLTDSIKAKDLFLKEISDFSDLPKNLKQIYARILINTNEFRGFFKYINAEIPNNENFISLLKLEFQNLICENANFNELINDYPIEFAYALSIIKSNKESINISKWVTNNFQSIYKVIETLRNIPCNNCSYCSTNLNIFYMLNHIFEYPTFRKYGNKPLQEQAAQSAINGESLLAIFPTGGGKSITFQLPALMQGKAINGLTVVISPLQSLMKDQIDDLKDHNITNATTINGLLDPIERTANFNLLIKNKINLIYIAPESLRSESMKNALFEQNIIRFVIDEAHCFSTWGQEFRVDYQYIGNFIKEYQEKAKKNIPISCFTATAKQQVIQDITNYFKDRLNKDLKIYEAESKRENLHYDIVECKDNEEKYKKIRDILSVNKVPTIIYCARTKKTIEIADRLTKEGIEARAFNGKMSLQEKKDNMEAFMNNKVSVIVATSAFGMGVNKKDVKFVIHYDISDSLENYIQEAGRAGRSQEIQADCLILFNKDDANKHFNLLNKTKLTFDEIFNLWNNIKKTVPEPGKPSDAPRFVSSPSLAKESGWQRGEEDVDTSIKTAVSILEQRNYVERCNNKYIIKATSINKDISSFADGDRIINEFKDNFKENELNYAKQILKALVSDKYKELAGEENTKPNAELLAYRLGIPEISVINCINKMRNIGVIADADDMTVYLSLKTTNDSMHKILEKYSYIWQIISESFVDGIFTLNIKDINEKIISHYNTHKKTYIKNIKNILYFIIEKEYIKKKRNTHNDNDWIIETLISVDKLNEISNLRNNICKYVINRLYSKLDRVVIYNKEKVPIHFSHKELLEENHIRLYLLTEEFDITNESLDEALLYLVRCNILNISGNFLVLYNRLGVKRLNLDNRKKFTQDDYSFLANFYKQKTHQIHIANKYCNIMFENHQKAEEFSLDYFKLSEKKFLEKYFTKQERKEIDRNITAEKYNEIFGKLSEEQLEVMNDSVSQFIVVAAGPGSGKTRLLVHKLASLLTVEEIPAEQLLMLTFSRAAATEFKIRLRKLVPNLTNIAIKTFHSFCFDLLGRKGDLLSIKEIIPLATELIKANQVEPKSITKQVIVIDEAQDMDENEYNLLEAIIERNENIKIISVGDDDQNIYEFFLEQREV